MPFTSEESEVTPTMSKNTFDALSKLALRVCVDPGKHPSQWIYTVDDAWLHNGCAGLDEGPLFKQTPCYDTGQPLVIDVSTAKSYFKLDTATAKGDSPDLLVSAGVTDDRPHPDSVPAETLLDFISEHSDRNYGICFCTFEFFWENVKSINLPQNAVFFDIRHKLMDKDNKSDLKEKWGERLSETKVFVTPKWDALGIQIYFAFKLGLHGQATQCKVDHNHLLILSSNLFGNESENGREKDENGKTGEDRANALLSFSAIQTEIWKKAAEVKRSMARGEDGDRKLAGLLDRKGTEYTFIPMPKHRTDGLFETALAILHNSFREAADWKFKMERLRHDMESLWSDPRPHEEWGHVGPTSAKLTELKSCDWLPPEMSNRQQDVRGAYLVQWRIESGVLIKTFDDFLRHAVDFGSVNFSPLHDDLGKRRIELPTRPGILFMLSIAEFVRALAEKQPDKGQVTPNIDWEEQTELKLVIRLSDAEDQVNNLAQLLFDEGEGGSPGGSAATLRRCVNCQLKMLDYLLEGTTPIKIGDIALNGKALRNEALETWRYHKVHRQRTFPQFEQDKIIFWFAPAEARQVGA